VSAHIADPLPTQPHQKTYVDLRLPELSIPRLQSDLNFLTTFNTRYFRSDTGVSAAKWIHDQFVAIAVNRPEITVTLYTHSFVQPSVVATIPGVGPNKDQFVVIGGHEDSVGSTSTGRSPGADDDGTGTVTVIEVFRVLVQAGYYPDRTVLFITYAGEEGGLLGSQDIANSYAAKSANVYGALQLDMTGWGGPIADIGVVGDYVDVNLTSFVKTLITAYTELDWVDTRCGYGCSDHASWTRAGYRSAFPFEVIFSSSNPYIHSANDIVSHLSFDRILEFAKLGLGFVVELAGTTIRP